MGICFSKKIINNKYKTIYIIPNSSNIYEEIPEDINSYYEAQKKYYTDQKNIRYIKY